MPLQVSASGQAGFQLVPAATTGILFSNFLPKSVSITNQILLDGSGVAAGDVDGDGACDLYFCAIDGRNSLYRNLGNWKFQDITETAGVGCSGLRSTGAALADLDGDGDLDLILNTAGNGTYVFANDGAGRFTARGPVLNPRRGGKSLALADVDGDGYLDAYIANYRVSALMDVADSRFTFKMVNGKQTVATFNGRPTTDPDLVDRFTIGPKGDFQENGEPDVFYKSAGGTNFVLHAFDGGSFLDETGRPLAQAPTDWGLAAAFRDINQDGLPDLYVCNDFQSPDRFWLNLGGGKFKLAPPLTQRRTSISSMCADFADINRDGHDDFVVVDMMSRRHVDRMRFLSVTYALDYPIGFYADRPQYEYNTLFLNRGDTTFAEISQFSGLEATDWTWSCIFLDVDLDGWEDLLVATGMERDGRDLDTIAEVRRLRAGRQPSEREILEARMKFPAHDEGTMAFRNRGDLTFADASRAWRFDARGICSAMALADLDGDGDQEVIVNALNGPAMIFRNDSPAPRIAVRLAGQAPNTRGIGARITVRGGAVPLQVQEMISGGRYLSSDDPMRVFAAGNAASPLTLEVAWRSGRRSLIPNVSPGFLYEVSEAAAQAPPPGHNPAQPVSAQDISRRSSQPLFEEATAQLKHRHQEERYDDFARQPLLPNKLSQSGPGLAWVDVDGDEREDLIVGSGKGGTLGICLNRGSKGFEALAEPAFAQPVQRDQTGLLAWRAGPNQLLLHAGSSNYEDGSGAGPAVLTYDLAAKSVSTNLAANASATGPLALAPIDGQMTLFVGGRVVPGRYPEAAGSRLFRFTAGQWVLDTENSASLEKIGLVSGAVFSDLDADGTPELVLACEWGPLRIFKSRNGRLQPWDPRVVIPATSPPQPSAATNLVALLSSSSTLGQLTGWWNSVTAGDFDGDGRLDLVAGNWGGNTPYQSRRTRPLSLYYGDLSEDGGVQLVEAYHDPELSKTVPARQLLSLAKSLPWLRGRFGSYREFSTVSMEQLLGERAGSARVCQANWLETTLFLNRGDHFEVRVLPTEAQLSPVFGLCAADFDGDGHEDIFLAQNFFATQPDTPRYDGGVGLLLLGNGRGDFRALSGQASGIEIYGEQRGAAFCDYDHDGRLDLAVAQNANATVLLRNVRATPGLRVQLSGGPGNPQGFGCVLKLRGSGGWGAAREIHAGSGYWSQNGTVAVLAIPGNPEEIQVRWPGGRTSSYPIPAEAKEIRISEAEGLKTGPSS
jgi:hypothetical protein